MKKHTSFPSLSAASMRQAQREAASLAREMARLRDSGAGLHGKIHAPVAKPLRGKTKRTVTQAPSFLGMGIGGWAGMAASEVLGTGYLSSAQQMGNLLATLALGQRVR